MYYIRTYEVISADDKVGRSYKQKQVVASTNGAFKVLQCVHS